MQCVFSNDLNTLVETVARVLSSPSEVSPLTPDWIIVPNQDTGRWLQIQLTDRLGSLSNTQMTTVTDFILDVSGTRPTEQLDSDLYWSIATLWREQNPELQEADYLQQVTRLFQLFQRYLIERPDWLLHWDQHRPSAPQMVWQAKLWQQIRPLLPDAPYASMIHAIKEPASQRLATVGRVIVFNPDRLSSLALEALEAWTHNTPCFLCLQSPSPSPWFTQGSLELPETHPVLADLCREKAKVLSTLGDRDVIEGFVHIQPTHGLSQLKQALFDNQHRPIAMDSSVALVAATSPTQEVIRLKHWITHWFNEHPSRSLRDLHIVTPNPALYGPIVQRVFHHSDLLEHLSTAPDPLIIQPLEVVSIQLLSNMAKSGFKAGPLFAFLCEPSVKASLKLTDHHLRQIQRWLIQSGARRGLSGYRHTLIAAKQRLLKGLMADPDDHWSSDSTPTEAIEQTYALDRLIAALTSVESILTAPSELPLGEAVHLIERALQRLTLGQVLNLNLAPLIEQWNNHTVSLGTVFEWLALKQSVGLSRPLALNDQLSVTAPQTIRSITTPAVAVLGANHDSFPSDSPIHLWDLIAHMPRPGDLVESDKERQVLADIIMNTEDALWISWIGRHPIQQSQELPGPGVVTLVDCFQHSTNNPVTELPMGLGLHPHAIEVSPHQSSEPAIRHHWTASNFLDTASQPARAFLEHKGVRLQPPDHPDLNLEPLTIDALNQFKVRDALVSQSLTRSDIQTVIQQHPELPDEIDFADALRSIAPSVVIDALDFDAQWIDPTILSIDDFTISIDQLQTVETPRIVVGDSVDSLRGLRVLLEGLLLYATTPTEESMRLVTFKNRVIPFGPIDSTTAKDLLASWLHHIADHHSPCPLISPLAMKTAKHLNKDPNTMEWIQWNDQALRFKPEYQRVWMHDSDISHKHHALVMELVVPLVNYLGRSRAAL